MEADLKELVGRRLVRCEKIGDDVIQFEVDDGSLYALWHRQGCCERVTIDDIAGDLSDLVGSPITLAEEVTSDSAPPPKGEYVDSYTWTFYRFATVKGYVNIRWYGESNGYYSESVNFDKEAK